MKNLLAPSLHRPTVEEWFGNPFIRDLNTSESLWWNSLTAYSIRLHPIADYIPAPLIEDNMLVLVLESSASIEIRHARRVIKKSAMTGILFSYPRGCEPMEGRWDASATVFFMNLSHQKLIEIAASTGYGNPEHIELLLSLGFYDSLLQHLAYGLHGEMQNGGLFGSLFADSVTTTMMLHLLRNHSNLSRMPEVKGGTLNSLQLRIVDDYIQAHLHGKITLADLANYLHMSVPHFEKMFRATLHRPPYQYVIESRIERAKLLLRNTQLSLFDIAQDCGFANQSHFTKHFTKTVGVSPTHFLRSVRG